MKAKKALEITFKSRVKILYKDAILEIKKACKKGHYHCKIPILNILKEEKAHYINEKLFEKLEAKGYYFGSSENHACRNTFWGEKELNKDDFKS